MSTDLENDLQFDAHMIPERRGPRPAAHAGLPHQQLDQIAPWELQQALWSRMVTLPGVRATGSPMSLPDTRALQLDRALANGPEVAFAPDGGTEFAHLHGRPDGSLHMFLPTEAAEAAIVAGWAEFHPYVLKGLLARHYVMIYGPRDAEEVDIAFRFVQLSRDFAAGVS